MIVRHGLAKRTMDRGLTRIIVKFKDGRQYRRYTAGHEMVQHRFVGEPAHEGQMTCRFAAAGIR